MDIDRVYQYLQNLQTDITRELQTIDGKASFETDSWQREAGGGGCSMVLRDGEYVMIREARIEAEYDADDCQTLLKAWAKTDEREYDVTGKVMSLIPLRNRRRTPDGEDLMTRITEGMTEYTLDGERIGYGLSEYLDQPKDDEDAG